MRRSWSGPLAAALLLLPHAALASTHTWTGAATSLWSDGANWVGGAPSPGEPNVALVFPTGVVQATCINDIINLTVETLDFGAEYYTLAGNPIALTGGITTDSGAPFRTVT